MILSVVGYVGAVGLCKEALLTVQQRATLETLQLLESSSGGLTAFPLQSPQILLDCTRLSYHRGEAFMKGELAIRWFWIIIHLILFFFFFLFATDMPTLQTLQEFGKMQWKKPAQLLIKYTCSFLCKTQHVRVPTVSCFSFSYRSPNVNRKLCGWNNCLRLNQAIQRKENGQLCIGGFLLALSV